MTTLISNLYRLTYLSPRLCLMLILECMTLLELLREMLHLVIICVPAIIVTQQLIQIGVIPHLFKSLAFKATHLQFVNLLQLLTIQHQIALGSSNAITCSKYLITIHCLRKLSSYYIMILTPGLILTLTPKFKVIWTCKLPLCIEFKQLKITFLS